MSLHVSVNTCGGQKRASNPLQFELKTFLNDLMLVLATWVLKTRVSGKVEVLLTSEASLSSPFLDIKKTKVEQKVLTTHPVLCPEVLYQMGGMYCLWGTGDDGMGLHTFHLRIPPALTPG